MSELLSDTLPHTLPHTGVLQLSVKSQRLLRLLDAGYVAELRRPNPGRTSHLYILRAPGSSEAAGRVVRNATMRRLIDHGHAVKIHVPSLDLTWVLSSRYYHRHEAAFAVLSGAVSTRTTNHPPPAFSPSFRQGATQ